MRRHRAGTLEDISPLKYHVELVKLLACCTMGKNVYTEIKCNSLLALDDIVAMISHPDCCVEVKEAYVDFLNHCYIDTEVEMKEIYSSHHMWSLFEKSFLVDINQLINSINNNVVITTTAAASALSTSGTAATVSFRGTALHHEHRANRQLETYVVNEVMNILSTFFNSPFSDQCTSLQVCFCRKIPRLKINNIFIFRLDK